MTLFQIIISIVAAVVLFGVWAVAAAIDGNTKATREKIDEVIEAIKELEEPLQKLDEIQGDLDSLHRIIGGRLYQRKYDKDTMGYTVDPINGPTIQELLQAISEQKQ